jgi:hypothetical protein
MTTALMMPITHYDPASHIDTTRLSRRINEPSALYHVQSWLPPNYVGLWPILAGQNASADMTFLATDLFEVQGIDGAVTGGWELSPRVNRAFGIVGGSQIAWPRQPKPARRISLKEAQHLAIEALLEAEERRADERKREAAFWAALEDEG